jgi:hypothetical protein
MNAENPQNFELFTKSWKAYQAIIEHDYLWHSMAATALNQWLSERFGTDFSFSFVDLACGDSSTTAGVLQNFPNVNYTGVDSSSQALNEASRNTSQMTHQRLVKSDYLDFLGTGHEKYDVIYIGLAAHHLGLENLDRFFNLICNRLNPGGAFIAYETFLLPDETLDEHKKRLSLMIRYFWSAMSPGYRQTVVEHVAVNDRPVSIADWNEKVTNAGLTTTQVLMNSPDRLCSMVISASK